MTMKMSEKNTAALKEALAAQQKLLQKLYNELDVEREASSTAASEALSMILRLQGEKAAMKMEAEQYKRLAEEKMCYAEESMEIFENLVCQKEMEVAALDYQVQSYKYKLESLGYNDPGTGDLKFPENLLQKNESLAGETSSAVAQSILSRRNSAPPSQLKLLHLKKGKVLDNPDNDLSTLKAVHEEQTEGEVNELKFLGSEKYSDASAADNIVSYWEQIRKLDERVKEITGEECANMRLGSRSPSQVPQTSNDIKKDVSNESGQPPNLLEHDVTTSSGCCPTVHDVFEVPQIRNKGDGHYLSKDEGKLIVEGDEECGKPKLIMKGDEKCEKPNFVPNDTIKSYIKEQVECLNKMLQAKHGELKLCHPTDDNAIGCHLAIVHPTTNSCDSQPKLQLVNNTAQTAEAGQTLEQEPSSSRTAEDELKLLTAIQEQLNSIQSEIKNLKTKKSPSIQDDLTMFSLMEAMVQFWL